MSRPTITFLGGVREIGGNKIVIEDGPDKILFDFGPSFSPEIEKWYVNFLQPRSANPVKDLLEFDLLPHVDGLYSAEALAGADLKHRAPEFHGVFLTHAHADHAGYLKFIDPTIPVYLGAGTRTLLDTIEQSSPVANYGDHDFRISDEGAPIRVGGLEVVPYAVDHSIPGARGYVIHTSEGAIAYTGDFRQHGPRASDTHRFVEAAQAAKPSMLITEGTRAGNDRRRNHSEAGVRSSVDEVLGASDQLAIACHYPRDLDRITTLYRAAVDRGREFVVSLKTAHLLEKAGPSFPDVHAPVWGKSPGLRAYRRKKSRPYKWETPYLDEAVDAEWVKAHGAKLLLSLDLQYFAELIDLRPPAGAPFIHSMSEPFSEDDLEDQVLHNWLDHFGMGFHQLHASGHASEGELAAIAREVAPKMLVPIHTEHPESFISFGPPVELVELNRPVELPR